MGTDSALRSLLEMTETRTASNVRTERRAKQYLVSLCQGFHECSPAAREFITTELIGDRLFQKSFDLVLLPDQHESPLRSITPEQLAVAKLVEVKSSSRKIPAGLKGYYFSVQQREIDLAQKMGERLVFGFVIIPRTIAQIHHEMLAWSEIQRRAKGMRTQINVDF